MVCSWEREEASRIKRLQRNFKWSAIGKRRRDHLIVRDYLNHVVVYSIW